MFADIGGKKCYETIYQNREGPCDFCTNPHLLDENGPTGRYTWEVKNPVTGHLYECRDVAIRWTDDRIVRLEIAIDITERKNG